MLPSVPVWRTMKDLSPHGTTAGATWVADPVPIWKGVPLLSDIQTVSLLPPRHTSRSFPPFLASERSFRVARPKGLPCTISKVYLLDSPFCPCANAAEAGARTAMTETPIISILCAELLLHLCLVALVFRYIAPNDSGLSAVPLDCAPVGSSLIHPPDTK